MIYRGVRTQYGTTESRRMIWKDRTKRVTFPYPKLEVDHEYPKYRGARGILREDRRTIS